MFIIHMPLDFKVGDSADCRINGEPKRVTYRDANTLVIGKNDARAIITTEVDGALRAFFCGHAGKSAEQYSRENAPMGGGFVIFPKPPTS